MCVAHSQLGIALGFLIPPQIVMKTSQGSEGMQEIAHGLTLLCYGVAIFSSFVLVAILLGKSPHYSLLPSVESVIEGLEE